MIKHALIGVWVIVAVAAMLAAGGAQMSGEGQSTTRGIEWDAYSTT